MDEFTKRIARLLFPNLIKDYDRKQYNLERIKKQYESIKSAQHDKEILEGCVATVNGLINDGMDVLGIDKTKLGEWLVIWRHPDDVDLYVTRVGKKYRGWFEGKVTSLLATFHEETKRIHIEDIQSNGGNHNRGYASSAMKHLFFLANRLGVTTITGKISFVDWDHVDRLKYFYEKHGFLVRLNPEAQSGSIRWEKES